MQSSSESVQSVLDDLRRLVRALGTFSRSAQGRVGLTGAQLFVLKSLAGRHPISLNELAARTHTDQSTVSVVVKRLAQAGLIARSVSTSDGRRLNLALSPAGRALLRKAPRAAQEDLIAALTQLPIKVRTRLAAGLRRLVEAMALSGERPPMFFEGLPGESRPRKSRRG